MIFLCQTVTFPVRKYLTQLKQTSPGPDGFPYWFWRDYAHHLAPVIRDRAEGGAGGALAPPTFLQE